MNRHKKLHERTKMDVVSIKFQFEQEAFDFEVVDSDCGKHTNNRYWFFVKDFVEKIYEYILIDSRLTVEYMNGDTLKINGCLESGKPANNDTTLLCVNCLYNPESLKYIVKE